MQNEKTDRLVHRGLTVRGASRHRSRPGYSHVLENYIHQDLCSGDCSGTAWPGQKNVSIFCDEARTIDSNPVSAPKRRDVQRRYPPGPVTVWGQIACAVPEAQGFVAGVPEVAPAPHDCIVSRRTPFAFACFTQKHIILRKGAQRPLFSSSAAARPRFFAFAALRKSTSSCARARSALCFLLPRPRGRGSSLLRLCAKACLSLLRASRKSTSSCARARRPDSALCFLLPRPRGRGSSLLRLCAKACLSLLRASRKSTSSCARARRPDSALCFLLPRPRGRGSSLLRLCAKACLSLLRASRKSTSSCARARRPDSALCFLLPRPRGRGSSLLRLCAKACLSLLRASRKSTSSCARARSARSAGLAQDYRITRTPGHRLVSASGGVRLSSRLRPGQTPCAAAWGNAGCALHPGWPPGRSRPGWP